jgi:predicted permease
VIARLGHALRNVLRRNQVERELADEIDAHLDLLVEEKVARGVSVTEAYRTSRLEVGRLEALKEDIRDVRVGAWLDVVRQDVRFSLRWMRRSLLVTLAVIATLAIVIGSAVTVFSISDAWLFRPLAFPKAGRLVVAFAATSTHPDEPAVWMPYRSYVAFKESARSFTSVSAAAFQPATWRTASGATSIVGMRVTPEFFLTLGVSPMRGRGLDASDAATGSPVVVLSYGLWRRSLGGEEVIGRSVMLNDAPYTVVGVMPADFDIRLLDQREGAAFWTILRTGERGYERGGIGPVAIVGRLKDGVGIAAAQEEIMTIMRQNESAYARNFNQPDATGATFVATLSSLQADNTRTVRATLLTVFAATVCLLLIGSINVGVLLLGRGLGRRGEVALRQALGAGRGRLVRQFVTESLVLSLCGSVTGVGLAFLATRLFLRWNPLGTLPGNAVQLDVRALAVAAVLLVITTLVAGLVPAVRMSAARPGGDLRIGERGSVATPALRAQRTMLVAQMAVSTVLLVCTALLAKTFIQLRTERLGFEPDAMTVATVVLPSRAFDSSQARNTFVDHFARELFALPGVTAVAASTVPPLVAGAPVPVNLTAVDEMSAPRMSVQDVTSDFFNTLRVPMVAGRTFDSRDGAKGVPAVVLNDRAATELFGNPSGALGQRLRLDDDPWREVVGVVGNVKTTFFNTLAWRTDPMVYRPAQQAFARLAPMATSFTLWVHIRSARPLSMAQVSAAAMAVGPIAAVTDVERAQDMVSAATRQPTFRMSLLLWLCGISLLLAAIGVYGVVTQSVTERLREIALRIALGARRRDVVLRFVRSALVSGGIGLAIGLGLTVTMGRVFHSLLYGVKATDALSLMLAATALLAVIGLAAWVPAMRGTRIDATEVLRG